MSPPCMALPGADKAALRRRLRALRRAVPAAQRRRAARRLVRLALRHRLLAAGRHMGFYIPAGAEIDVLPLMRRALDIGVRCYLPVVPAPRRRKLGFSPLPDFPGRAWHWRANRFGIPEYRPPGGPVVRALRLHRIFVPLLGFDAHGHRLGMGGGFYDATLAFRRLRRAWHAPQLVGVAFACQEVNGLPADAWDVRLDAVLTELALHRTGPGGGQ